MRIDKGKSPIHQLQNNDKYSVPVYVTGCFHSTTNSAYVVFHNRIFLKMVQHIIFRYRRARAALVPYANLLHYPIFEDNTPNEDVRLPRLDPP